MASAIAASTGTRRRAPRRDRDVKTRFGSRPSRRAACRRLITGFEIPDAAAQVATWSSRAPAHVDQLVVAAAALRAAPRSRGSASTTCTWRPRERAPCGAGRSHRSPERRGRAARASRRRARRTIRVQPPGAAARDRSPARRAHRPPAPARGARGGATRKPLAREQAERGHRHDREAPEEQDHTAREEVRNGGRGGDDDHTTTSRAREHRAEPESRESSAAGVQLRLRNTQVHTTIMSARGRYGSTGGTPRGTGMPA